MKSEYEENGCYLIERALGNDQVSQLISELSFFEKEINNYGIRNLMNKVPYIHNLANSEPLISIVKEILGDNAKPIGLMSITSYPLISLSLIVKGAITDMIRTYSKRLDALRRCDPGG
jgi:hypothetical protein